MERAEVELRTVGLQFGLCGPTVGHHVGGGHVDLSLVGHLVDGDPGDLEDLVTQDLVECEERGQVVDDDPAAVGEVCGVPPDLVEVHDGCGDVRVRKCRAQGVETPEADVGLLGGFGRDQQDRPGGLDQAPTRRDRIAGDVELLEGGSSATEVHEGPSAPVGEHADLFLDEGHALGVLGEEEVVASLWTTGDQVDDRVLGCHDLVGELLAGAEARVGLGILGGVSEDDRLVLVDPVWDEGLGGDAAVVDPEFDAEAFAECHEARGVAHLELAAASGISLLEPLGAGLGELLLGDRLVDGPTAEQQADLVLWEEQTCERCEDRVVGVHSVGVDQEEVRLLFVVFGDHFYSSGSKFRTFLPPSKVYSADSGVEESDSLSVILTGHLGTRCTDSDEGHD